MIFGQLHINGTLQESDGAPRYFSTLSPGQDELNGQPAKMCDLRDTLLEPWLWDARGGLCFEDEVSDERFMSPAPAGSSHRETTAK